MYYGLCVYCSVNVEKYEQLLAMGYPQGASAEALRQTNNDLGLAIQVRAC